eukprot:g16487.t1
MDSCMAESSTRSSQLSQLGGRVAALVGGGPAGLLGPVAKVPQQDPARLPEELCLAAEAAAWTAASAAAVTPKVTMQKLEVALRWNPQQLPAAFFGALYAGVGGLTQAELRRQSWLTAAAARKMRRMHQRVKKIFLEADTDKNGVLSKDELTAVIQKLSKWDDETVEELMKQCDYNKDGMLQITEFVDFLFRGTRKQREIQEGTITCVSLMAMHEAYYDDLHDIVHDFLQKHQITRIDFNWEDAWPNAVEYCELNHVDVLSIDSDAIRVAVGDRGELWYERDMWFDKREIPEEKLFDVLPLVKEIFAKSLNPLLALEILWCPPGSPEGGVDRLRRNLNSWNGGIKKMLRTKEEQLAANERFKERASHMEALIAAAEEAERIEKEKDLAAFKPLWDQVVAKAGWEDAKAQQVFDHMVRGNMYTETWYIHAFTEGHVEKDLEKIGVEQFAEDDMQILTDFAFEHDELSKTVRNLTA